MGSTRLRGGGKGIDDGGTTRERILGAALRLFASKGFAGTGIREIASGAGVTTATLYHYAATKEDLLTTLMQRGMDRLLGATGWMLSQLETPEQRLAALVRLHVTVHGIQHLSATVNDAELRALGEERRAAIVRKRDEYEQHWRAALADGVASGAFRVGDGKLTSLALLEMCTGVARWYRPDGEMSVREISVRYADMALSLVGAERDGKPLRVDGLELPEAVEAYLDEGAGAH
jgi:AcrR family transcriptional regulator